MNSENKNVKFDTKKKKYYILGITGICILAVIMFLAYRFKFSESHEGKQLIYTGIRTEEENKTTLKVDIWLSTGFMGYVVETDQKDNFEENALIKVMFNNDVEVVYANGEKFVYHEEKPNAERCSIEPGSIVQVKYHAYGTEEENDENRIEADGVKFTNLTKTQDFCMAGDSGGIVYTYYDSQYQPCGIVKGKGSGYAVYVKASEIGNAINAYPY